MRKSSATYAEQSDPTRTPHFRRRWTDATPGASKASAEPIKLIEIPGAFDADGEPRAALLVPPAATSISRRPALQMFATLAAAIAAKRSLEAGR